LPTETGSESYRWSIVFACALGLALGAPTFLIYSFGVFIIPLAEGLETGRAAISFALSIGMLGILIAAPLVGILSDRYGARRMVLIGVVAFALVLAGYSLVQTAMHLYLASLLMAFFGAGTGPVTYTRIVASWFNRRRGLALGIALIGIGVGGALAPVVSQALISAYGWRSAYMYLGLIVFIISFPPLFLLLRDRPPSTPKQASTDPAAVEVPDTEEGIPVKEALRKKEFWILAIGFLIVAMGNSGGLVHLAPLLTDAGLTPASAANYAGLMGIGVIFGRLLGGYLLDIFHAPYVAICFLLGPFIGYAYFQSGIDPAFAFVPVLLFGIGMGAEFDVIPFLVTRYFGLKNFGLIYGINISTFSIGTGAGPTIMGIGFDNYGNYKISIMIAMGCLIVGSLLISQLGKYRFT